VKRMAAWFHIAINVVVGAVGLLLLYAAFFLYEDEEQRIQNRLENTWTRFREYHATAVSKQTAFLQLVIKITSRILDVVFGKKLLSVQSVAVAASLSTASLFLLFRVRFPVGETPSTVSCVWFGMLFLLISALLIMGARINLPTYKHTYLGLLIALTLSDVSVSFAVGGEWILPELVLLGIVCDIFFVALCRLVLLKMQSVDRFWKLSLCVVAASALTVMPLTPYVLTTIYTTVWQRTFFVLVTLTNAFDGLLAASLLGVLLLMLLHLMLWPLIERPVYAAARHKLIGNHKLLGTLGVACLVFAFRSVPPVNHLLKAAGKVVGLTS
jgi:hypothetical protein